MALRSVVFRLFSLFMTYLTQTVRIPYISCPVDNDINLKQWFSLQCIFTCAKEVMYSLALVYLFVCLQDYPKCTHLIFAKIGGKVAHGPRKNQLDFGDNPIHVTLDQ